MIHFAGTYDHYLRHLRPICDAIPDGRMHTTGQRLNVPGETVVVAGQRDLSRVRGAKVVLVEHGAGQTYGYPHVSYSNGEGCETVDLFVCPSETVAERRRSLYPEAEAVAVGCPALDPWHRGERGAVEPDLVVMSFHYDEHRVAPESRSAFRHYGDHLRNIGADLARRGLRLAGHAHPRVLGQTRRVFEKAGLPFIDDFAEVLDRAACYVVDNSSSAYEFASLGRPIVWLNAPWYRRDVEHGLRFWALSGNGLHADGPEDVAEAVVTSLGHDPRSAIRALVTALVYESTDGTAAERAARAIAALTAERAAV